MATTTEATRAPAFRPEFATVLGTGVDRPGWDLATEQRIDNGQMLANGIGWFSIGLGLAEVVAPDRIGRALGMEHRTGLIRAYGLRELAKGAAILTRRRPTGWMWGRVAGDGLDLATLATGLDRDNPKRDNVMMVMAAVAGVAALDVLCAVQLGRSGPGRHGQRLQH